MKRIDFKEPELKIILDCIVNCIRYEHREPEMEEYNIIQRIKNNIKLT